MPDPEETLRQSAEMKAAARLERARLVGQVGLVKAELNMAPYQPGRFGEMMIRLRERAYMIGLEQARVEKYWNEMHTDSVKAQEANATLDQTIQI